MGNLLWIIVVILILMWIGGISFGFGGNLIHLLLAIIVIVVIVRLVTGRKVV
jgi:hypothetical protein